MHAPSRSLAPRPPTGHRATQARRSARACCLRSRAPPRRSAVVHRRGHASRGRRCPGVRAACEHSRATTQRTAAHPYGHASPERRASCQARRAATHSTGAPRSRRSRSASASASASAVAADGTRRCATSRIPLEPINSDAPAPSSSGEASAASWSSPTIAGRSMAERAHLPLRDDRAHAASRRHRHRARAGRRLPACLGRRRLGASARGGGGDTPTPRHDKSQRSHRARRKRSSSSQRAAGGAPGRTAAPSPRESRCTSRPWASGERCTR